MVGLSFFRLNNALRSTRVQYRYVILVFAAQRGYHPDGRFPTRKHGILAPTATYGAKRPHLAGNVLPSRITFNITANPLRIMTPTQQKTSFDRMYDRKRPAYGLEPAGELTAVLNEQVSSGEALDLGCGAGRNALAMAEAGLSVIAIDQSIRGIERLEQEASDRRIAGRVQARTEDVVDLRWADRRYDLVAAVTILDHLTDHAMKQVWKAIGQSLKPTGLLLVEVHTVEDPGCDVAGGPEAPVSESASHVIRYFRPNELLEMTRNELHIIRYEERQERDRSHGRPHRHAKASLLASPASNAVNFFGFPERC